MSSSAPPANSSFSTINSDEIAHFSRLSSQWWDEQGEFGLLHKMNPTRMEFVRQKVMQGKQDDAGWDLSMRDRVGPDGRVVKTSGDVKGKGKWLEGMDVLDVGCGGGLLAEVGVLPYQRSSELLT
jgi:2-polyprenyl-6-hydroxyphenyl methylase/3-demethylubiquinone-9 3-methyltransferase